MNETRNDSVEEEEALPGGVAQAHPGPACDEEKFQRSPIGADVLLSHSPLDAHVLQDGPHADEHPEAHDEPPEPRAVRVVDRQVVLDAAGVMVGHAVAAAADGGPVMVSAKFDAVKGGVDREVGRLLDDQGPLGEGETEAGKRSVPVG